MNPFLLHSTKLKTYSFHTEEQFRIVTQQLRNHLTREKILVCKKLGSAFSHGLYVHDKGRVINPPFYSSQIVYWIKKISLFRIKLVLCEYILVDLISKIISTKKFFSHYIASFHNLKNEIVVIREAKLLIMHDQRYSNGKDLTYLPWHRLSMICAKTVNRYKRGWWGSTQLKMRSL